MSSATSRRGFNRQSVPNCRNTLNLRCALTEGSSAVPASGGCGTPIALFTDPPPQPLPACPPATLYAEWKASVVPPPKLIGALENSWLQSESLVRTRIEIHRYQSAATNGIRSNVAGARGIAGLNQISLPPAAHPFLRSARH